TSANDFARIPVSVGSSRFVDAVIIVSPFIVPFEVWSVRSEFNLDVAEDDTKEIVEHHAEELLTLLSLGISDAQGHGVFDLDDVLDLLTSLNPTFRGDYRLLKLQRMTRSPRLP